MSVHRRILGCQLEFRCSDGISQLQRPERCNGLDHRDSGNPDLADSLDGLLFVERHPEIRAEHLHLEDVVHVIHRDGAIFDDRQLLTGHTVGTHGHLLHTAHNPTPLHDTSHGGTGHIPLPGTTKLPPHNSVDISFHELTGGQSSRGGVESNERASAPVPNAADEQRRHARNSSARYLPGARAHWTGPLIARGCGGRSLEGWPVRVASDPREATHLTGTPKHQSPNATTATIPMPMRTGAARRSSGGMNV